MVEEEGEEEENEKEQGEEEKEEEEEKGEEKETEPERLGKSERGRKRQKGRASGAAFPLPFLRSLVRALRALRLQLSPGEAGNWVGFYGAAPPPPLAQPGSPPSAAPGTPSLVALSAALSPVSGRETPAASGASRPGRLGPRPASRARSPQSGPRGAPLPSPIRRAGARPVSALPGLRDRPRPPGRR